MEKPVAPLHESPSQTAGPYVHIGCLPNLLGVRGLYPEDLGRAPVRDGARGVPVTLVGQVIDGNGEALRDVMLETWQADAAGRYPGHHPDADPAVTGWARLAADFESGAWRMTTVKPGCVTGPDGRVMAPHLILWIVARGIKLALQTRICFADEAEANASCPVLVLAGDRAATLLAQGDGAGLYRFDVHLQGPHETVFFDV